MTRAHSLRFAFAGLLSLSPALVQASSYLCFGDSITVGNSGSNRAAYLGLLGDYLSTRQPTPAEMINQGLSGENTTGGRSRLSAVVASRRTDYVLIMEGTNDVFLWFREPGFDPNQTQTNLRAMVQSVKAAGEIPILATVVPRLPSDRNDPTNAMTRQLNDRIRSVAAAENVPLAEVFNNLFPRLDPVLYDDPLHPNDLGQGLVAEAFAAAILAQPIGDIDLTAPLPLTIQPGPFSQRNGIDVTLRIGIAEDKHPIDPLTAVLTIDGTAVTAVVDTTTIAGQTLFIHDFPQLLGFGRTVAVTFTVADTNPTPNRLSIAYTFKTSTGNGTNGDLDRSGRIDGLDLAILAASFGVDYRDPRFNAVADIDASGVVDGFDLMLLTGKFGGPP